MTIAFLATGDELVYGDSLNTNSRTMAQHLSSEGISVGLHLVCSDHEQDIIDSLRFLNQKHKTIIITGGLGPTSDDRTRFALAKYVDEPLVVHEKALQHIQERLARAGLSLCDGNRQQALFPTHTVLIDNPNGTAMGGYFTSNQTLFILLPGPPRECIPMFEKVVIPLLSQQSSNESLLLKWMVYGYAESELARQVEEALEDLDCQTGYRLDLPYIELKVRCQPEWVEKVKERVEPMIKDDVFCAAGMKASAQLKQQIIAMKKTICIRDEVTGGILQSLIDSPETREFLSFLPDNRAEYQFHLTGLQDYWQQKDYQGKTELQIQAKLDDGEERIEKKQLPFRSQNVVYYAAEWLAFRLTYFLKIIHNGVA